MKSEEDDEQFNMAEEELRQWVRVQVEKDGRLVQRRAQLEQVEDWVKQKEKEAMYTKLLYNNACKSVFECESVVKGLYGMLGLEYRDTDSEEEEEGQAMANIIQIIDSDLDNGNDEHADNADEDDEYVVIDLGAAVPEAAVMKEQKGVDTSAAIESTECSGQPLAHKVKESESVDPPAREKAAPDDLLACVKTEAAPTAPSPSELSARCLTLKRESSPVLLGTSIPLNETAPASMKDTDRIETPITQNAQKTQTMVEATLTSTASSLASKTVSVNHKPDSKSRCSDAASTSDSAGETTEKVKQTSSKSGSDPLGCASKAPGGAPGIKPKTVNTKQGDKPETKSSGSQSDPKDAAAADKTSTNATSAKPPDAKEVSRTTAPARLQQEVPLKVNMRILGRRRTKTWHHGKILDIKLTESEPRYKILFEGGKGKSVVSAHHLACVESPALKELFVGCRVVASYKEDDQSWFHAAVVAEMPDRKNRMRFLVFFDDGRSAYLALPDLHLVCKPLTNITKDIEDEVCRADVEEYLQTYPVPIFVVMRVGQESTVERNGKMEPCTISQVDGSLIQIRYKKDEKTEWIFKGSSRLEQIRKIKQRINQQKKETAVNKAGWITPTNNTKLAPTTTKSTTNTTNTTSSTPATVTSSTPVQTSTAQSVPQAVTASSSETAAFSGESALQPRVILKRVSVQSLQKTAKIPTHSETPGTSSSSSGTKRPPPGEEDGRLKSALLPGVGPRLKYVPHRCCPACMNDVRPVQKDQHRGQNPLFIPLLHKFRRMTARRRVDGKMSFHVFYRAPCGRSLCVMEELQAFLFESRCDFLFLDMFCLDPFVLVKRASRPSSMCSQPHLFLPDISEGEELVPVQCVNELSAVAPPRLTYTRNRVPAPGVIVNTSLDFMVGCDCTDGCRDRSKCACYQMTVEATSLFPGGPVDVTAGYTHKRLPQYIPTGVYECNSLCHCDPRLCSNRLVQHGLQLRLEVFMTRHKGWGLRCLDDVSKGTFVCIFTGKVVKDEAVSAENSMSANEYLANLDYIEGVAKLKEGYESDAYCSDKEKESEKKTLATMTTGALKRDEVFLIDSSSNNSEDQKVRDEESDDDGDLDDVDFKISTTDWTEEDRKLMSDECNRNYTTRKSAKIPEGKEFRPAVQTSATVLEEQTEVTAYMAKKMRKEGPGGPRTGFAKKSTRALAIKSSHRRVKPQAEPEKSVAGEKTAHDRRCTRSLFDDEKACYLIDAKQEGNLARYINHSCSPNLFVQNVFVDTHDLRFPWVAFFTSKRIRAGTELTWDYSYEVGSVEGKVLLCCCGSSECVGRLL